MIIKPADNILHKSAPEKANEELLEKSTKYMVNSEAIELKKPDLICLNINNKNHKGSKAKKIIVERLSLTKNFVQ